MFRNISKYVIYRNIGMKRKSIQNIFSGTSSLIFRALLSNPEKKWKLGELSRLGASQGLVSEALTKAEALGYVERISKGPNSYTRLIRKDNLLKDWPETYTFDRNQQAYYLYVGKNFLKESHHYFKEQGIVHAYTLFSASRLLSPYVKDDRHFVYLDVERDQFASLLKKLELQFNLYQLVQGGNVCFVLPYYRHAVFKDMQIVKGVPIVSNLQLYLDLMGFSPGGPEEAQHLIKDSEKKGKFFV